MDLLLELTKTKPIHRSKSCLDLKELFNKYNKHDNTRQQHHTYNTRSKDNHYKYNYVDMNSKDIKIENNYHANSNTHKRKHDYSENNHKHNHSKVLKFDRNFELYLKDIEDITGKRLMPIQRQELKYHIDNFEYKRLSPEKSHEHRREFNSKKKEIIAEWELMSGRKWDTYDKPVYSKSGKIIRQVGSRYDLHHLIECSWGGDNEAWNSHPARHPDEHNQQIHRKNGLADRIFN